MSSIHITQAHEERAEEVMQWELTLVEFESKFTEVVPDSVNIPGNQKKCVPRDIQMTQEGNVSSACFDDGLQQHDHMLLLHGFSVDQ